MIGRLFTSHPHSVGESYLEHLGVATRFGGTMIAGGVACVIHGLVPALFTRTGSGTVKRLNDRMTSRVAVETPAGTEWQLVYEI
jgi:hypothetical protein